MAAGLKATELAAQHELSFSSAENRLRRSPNQRVAIATDYAWLPRTFAKTRRLPIQAAGRSAHPDLTETIRLPETAQFLWNKGHIGIPGSDVVDNGAKQAAAKLPLVEHSSLPGDIVVYGAPMTGGFLKAALRTVVPTAYRRYAVKDCHPAISALKIQPHRLCTLQQWKRGILNLAGFDAWQRFQERPLAVYAIPISTPGMCKGL